MGGLLSFLHTQPLSEQLEQTEKAINAVRKNRFQSQQKQKRLVAAVTLWSLVLYVTATASLLWYYFPTSWKLRILYSLPLFLAPIIAYTLRKLVLMYFSGRIKSADEELRCLIDKKKTLLDHVREKESYKKAKEILEKYDPEVIQMKNMAEELQKLRSQSANSDLRKRMLPNQNTPIALTPNARGVLNSHRTQMGGMTTPQSGFQRGANTAPGSPLQTPHRLPDKNEVHSEKDTLFVRPMPPPSVGRSGTKSTFDRMMEYIVGDGPGNRYALICTHCLNHNGMALKEEYEFIAFRCGYCGMANPAKKSRPVPPRIPTPMGLSPKKDKPTEAAESVREISEDPRMGGDSKMAENLNLDEEEENVEDRGSGEDESAEGGASGGEAGKNANREESFDESEDDECVIQNMGILNSDDLDTDGNNEEPMETGDGSGGTNAASEEAIDAQRCSTNGGEFNDNKDEATSSEASVDSSSNANTAAAELQSKYQSEHHERSLSEQDLPQELSLLSQNDSKLPDLIQNS